MSEIIRIGTRKSRLALEQTRLMQRELENAFSDLSCELVTRETTGDQIIDRPLQVFGGKGVFVEEFESAILNGAMDLAIHSAKDMPMELAEGLIIGAVSSREDPRDVLVTTADFCFKDLTSFRVGTSSPRRQLQVRLLWEEIWKELVSPANIGGETERNASLPVPPPICETLRGNVSTRLEKLKAGLYDGIILASAGLKRLGICEEEGYRFLYLDPHRFIPAGGQGIMAAEAKADTRAARLCQTIDNKEARLCLELERSILHMLGAGCHEPIGVYSEISDGFLEVWGIRGCDSEVKRIHLRDRADQEGSARLAAKAWKGLE